MLNSALIKIEYFVILGESKVVDRDLTLCTNCGSKFFSREFNVSLICQGRLGIWVSYQLSISSFNKTRNIFHSQL